MMRTPSAVSGSNWLKEVYHQERPEQPTVIVVYIANITTTEKASQRSVNWPLLLSQISRFDTIVLEFQHDTPFENPLSRLLENSGCLMDDLFCQYLKRKGTQAESTLIFLSEGLGGLLLKEAIAQAGCNPSRWQKHLNTISAMVFLGTPHIKETNDIIKSQLYNVLRASGKPSAKRDLSPQNLNSLYLSASQFVSTVSLTNSNVRILSGYETHATRLPTSTWSRNNQSVILVDKAFAEINLPNEVLEAIDSDILKSQDKSRFRDCLCQQIGDSIKEIEMQATESVNKSSSAREERLAGPTNSISHLNAGMHRTTLSMDNVSSSASQVDTPQSTRSGSNMESLTPKSLLQTTDGAALNGSAKVLNIPYIYPRSCTTPNKSLLHRKNIVEQIADTLIPSRLPEELPRPNLLTFVLTGLGGTGKTSIATQFLQKYQQSFDVILFFKADQVGRLSEQYAKVAVEFGLVELGTGSDLDSCREAVKTWLENPVAKQYKSSQSADQDVKLLGQATWLLILDNADDANVLADYWPVAGFGSVLVTSRDPFTRTQYFYPTAGIQLEGLQENEGIELLKTLTGNSSTKYCSDLEKAARAITRRLGGLPLALYQIGAIIQRRGYSLAGFLATYTRDSDYYELYDERPILRGYEYNIGSVWAFESIDNASAMALLQTVSMLDPEVIQEELLVGLDTAIIVTYPTTRKAYHQALSCLLETSMVEKNREDNSLSVHRLVQDVCRARMAKVKGESQAAFHLAQHAISLQWPYTITKRQFKTASAGKIDRWAKCGILYSHIVSLSKNYEELSHMKKIESPSLELVDLICEAAWFQYERGEASETVSLLEHADMICEDGGLKAKPHLKSLYGCWIGVATTIGDVKMLFHYCKLRLDFADAEFEESGTISSFRATAYNDMGQAYSMNHLPEKAIPYLETSREIRLELPGFRKDWLFSPSYHLALAYTCWGYHEKAFEIIHQAINDRIEVLGPNDRDSVRTGALYYVAGNIQNSRGLFDDAFGWHQKALLHCQQTAGETSLVALRCINKVAEHYIRHGDTRYGYESASRPMLQTVLDICGARPSRQREVARASFLLAQVAARENKISEVGILKQRAASVYNQMRPDDRREPETLNHEDIESLVYYDFL